MSVFSRLKQQINKQLGLDLELKDRVSPPERKTKTEYQSQEDAIAAYRKYGEWFVARNAELAAGNLTREEANEFGSIVKSEQAAWNRLAESFRSA